MLSSGVVPVRRQPDARRYATIGLVAAGIILGGGGTSNPTTEILLQITTAILIGVWCLARNQAERQPTAGAALLCILVLALPAIQLVPLPPSLWQSLPGREVEIAALSLIGRQDVWMPWSIIPGRTFATLIAMIPPLAMMWFVASLGDRARNDVLVTIVIVALASVVLGGFQLAAPRDKIPSFYSYIHRGYVIGFQASRNAEVDVLLVGILAATSVYSHQIARGGRKVTANVAYCATVLVLLIGAILTGSRGGILLIPATALLALLIAEPGEIFARRTLIGVCGMAIALIQTAWLLRDNAALGKVAARFASDPDFRFEIWTDTVFAIQQYWPFGGGMGSFVSLMTPVERLEVVDITLPSRAHNDYLELLLEGGVFAAVWLAAIAACVAAMFVKCKKAQSAIGSHRRFAGAVMFVIAAHSIVDYPMRSMALTILIGAAAGMVAPTVTAARRGVA